MASIFIRTVPDGQCMVCHKKRFHYPNYATSSTKNTCHGSSSMGWTVEELPKDSIQLTTKALWYVVQEIMVVIRHTESKFAYFRITCESFTFP
ncbi:hypothetical protein TNIN_269531 [Trichonephila inaurata madagascariensis]|uniref:Uncharacterized protein n=1 Tax=Trichonephila inaurata madagascariensis TaxID=2747483 RepID=A0A8X7C154_9ARAC|nr:hypothetical protein TNIN_269531 [Trichonephila inaurata madagascariensis]